MSRSELRRRPAGVLVAGALLLAVVWGVGPPSRPPLYDSTLTAAEPYRYCQTPAGFSPGLAPALVDHNVLVMNGQSPAIAGSTGESSPQAELLAPAGAFVVPPGTVTIRVAIRCAPPSSVLPLDGRLDGNVYEFLLAAGGTPLAIRPGQQVTVVLRGPAGLPGPVMERFSTGQWARLDTQPLGNTSPDTYASNVTELGDIALVVANSVVPVDTGADHTGLFLVLTAVAVALFAAGGLYTLRGRRPRPGR